ncbi:MAG: peptide chain release factor N(5)-glutamine methyltransferase [Minwuia sp.]|nr:peptide chain release factor N(5)-glutamine methyltransferase [Minwuia sp.]
MQRTPDPATVGALLDEATTRLRHGGIPTARLDARVLLGHAMNVAPASLLPGSMRAVARPEARAFQSLIARRLLRAPVSHLTGSREFFGRLFRVTPDVLDPRADSECVVEMALSFLSPDRPVKILDLGTGSGCLILTLLAERPMAMGTGVDISEAALHVARDNARTLGLANRVMFQTGHWLDGIAASFDLIISNPPYITEADMAGLQPEVRDHEPRLALVGGTDGLDAYRQICPHVGPRLLPNGVVVFEFGQDQGEAVRTIARQSGLETIHAVRDLGDIERGITLKSTDSA